jgi:uncharacterized protein (UPF0335 family)
MAEATDKRLLAGVLKAEEFIAERAAVNDKLAALFAWFKAEGYDGKTVRQIIKRRAMEPADRAAADDLLAEYECALGMEFAPMGEVTMDPALRAKLLGPSPERKAPTLKQRHASDAVALAQISRMNRGV